METMETEVVKSRRGVNLIHAGYAYRRDRATIHFQHWRCSNSRCPGRLKADLSDPPIVIRVSGHDHLPDEDLTRARVVKAELCARAKADPFIPLSQVYNDWLAEQGVAPEDVAMYPSFESCRSMMHRSRKQVTEKESVYIDTDITLVEGEDEKLVESSACVENKQGGSGGRATKTEEKLETSMQSESYSVEVGDDEMNTAEAELVRFCGGVNLIYANFIYIGDKAYDQYQHWKCRRPGCPGRMKTDLAVPPTVIRASNHNHPPDRKLVKERLIKAELCARAMENPSMPLSQIYNEIAAEQGEDAGEDGNMPSFSSCRSMMHRSRKKGASQDFSIPLDNYSIAEERAELNQASMYQHVKVDQHENNDQYVKIDQHKKVDQYVKVDECQEADPYVEADANDSDDHVESEMVVQPEDSAEAAAVEPETENDQVYQKSSPEQDQGTADRLARLQQYRQGTWELNFDLESFERWRQIGLIQGLCSDTEIACFLMLHFEKTKTWGKGRAGTMSTCRVCGTKLTLSCHKCGDATHSMQSHETAEKCGEDAEHEDMHVEPQDYLNEDGVEQNIAEEEEQREGLSCSVCSATFTRALSLKVHMRKHTGERPYICNTCGAMFTHSSSLSVHKRSHTGHKPYVCEQCGAAFSVGSVLKQHMRKHSGEKPFQCKLCPSAFTQSTKLTIHMRRHTGVKPYQCEHCGTAFTHSHALKIHLRSHSGDKPYVCQDCGKAFSQSAHLTVHTRIHTGDRPFRCEKCGAAFLDSTHLRRHERTHNAEKSNQCQECGASFSTAFALRRHAWSHTDYEKPYKCSDCFKTFTTNFCLKRHVQKGRCKPSEIGSHRQSLSDNNLESVQNFDAVS